MHISTIIHSWVKYSWVIAIYIDNGVPILYLPLIYAQRYQI